MVLPIFDEDRRYRSMSRCPKLEGCDSPLCPLDPYLKNTVSVPGLPLCFWYTKASQMRNFDGMPLCVLDKLPIYIVHLYRLGVLDPHGAKKPRGRSRG